VRRHAAWFLAVHALSEGDAEAARARLADLGGDATMSGLPRFMVDTTDCPELVRLALAARDDDLACTGVGVAEERQRLNPGVGSIAAAAAHARGLFEHDLALLADAVARFSDGPRPLARASANEDYGVELLQDGDRTSAAEQFGVALETYATAGATWDAARVRCRLRLLGVRRRLVRVAHPANGWAALTDAELAVVRLVAEGLTNRVVAERLFVSPHTVSMHLRHAFTKLDINSRVDLTRLVFMNEDLAA
jgi:DNA-binding CsgD family transcriptional regulator